MKNALIIGSSCVDVIIRIDHLPKTEENLHPDSQRFAIGGCAYNVANIIGRGGAQMTFVTPVGLRGVFGGFVKRELDALGFADYVELPDEENGCCYCFVENSGERTFMSIHGAEYTFDPAWMAQYNGREFDYGYVCGLEIEERTGEKLVSYLETAKIGTLFYAPGPRGAGIKKELTDRLFALHPVLHLNAGEAKALSGESETENALAALYARTGNTVIATAGSEGVHVYDEAGMRTIPGEHAEKIVDTIGAGDSHIGTTMLGLCRGMELDAALALANRVSCAVVQTSGATLGEDDFRRILG